MGAVAFAGALGGLVNALMTDKYLGLPHPDVIDGQTVWKLGFIGNT